MSPTCGELARDCGGDLRGPAETRISGVSTDSRDLAPGALFVALSGEHFEGHEFVDQARAAGAAALLVSRDVESGGLPTIRVRDTLVALGDLARARRERFRGPVIAITGSNGKTTTREMCASILTESGHRVRRSPRNFNNEVGAPLTVLGLRRGDSALVVELGMNHPGEIDRLARIVSPDVGAITQIAPAHLGPLGSLEAIAAAKGELLARIRPAGSAVLNADDPRVLELGVRFSGRRTLFGLAPDAEIRAGRIEVCPRGLEFDLSTPEGGVRIAISGLGRHLVSNALCAVAAARATGLGGQALLQASRDGLARFVPVAGRLEPREGAGGVLWIDDTYNANPVSVEAALQALREVSGSGRRIAVLGDMLELGSDEAELHAGTGTAAARARVAVLVCVGERSRHTGRAARAAGVPETVCVDSSEAAVRELGKRLTRGDVVLVKGSRAMRLEEIVEALSREPR
ncbi:MAG: UDP-N-acetylmuramoyl-tripeptide--D-alanyl-D-alanine ligase [Myxococcota bacterium]